MSGAISDAPFIITAELPDGLGKWATDLRTRHFPPERNYLSAHVTLFHALPPSAEGEIKRALASISAENAPVEARLDGIMPLGKGTALKLSSSGILHIWEELADRFHGLLIPQDQQKPRLHVTIQNKVDPSEAKALQQQLELQVEPRDFRFSGLSLHIYRGGPWDFVRTYPFRG
ncbi:2'-5' RNA ligase family protein [Pontixanthobacter luteolus]|uniref:2'-5' RNA ligase family protein n=1 Tax=Pontixanthobacter luteolus TaxID=295089 RepID=UPI0030B823E7